MITHKLKRLPKQTLEIDVTITKDEIQTQYNKAFEALLPQFEMKGYRKGKAPRELAEKQISRDSVYQQMIRNFFPDIYADIVKKENLQPIISPKIELKKAKEGEDWEITFHVAEKPNVDIKNYKEIVQKAKGNAKTADIWVPGKEPQQEAAEHDKKQHVLNEILTALLKDVSFELSDLIVEDELNQRLSKLVDDIQRIGLTTEAYLSSKNLTMDSLKAQFKREIEETYKIEFILMAIADEAKISVNQEELDKLFSSITNEKERASAVQNAYFYATILRKQKTLEYLNSL